MGLSSLIYIYTFWLSMEHDIQHPGPQALETPQDVASLEVSPEISLQTRYIEVVYG